MTKNINKKPCCSFCFFFFWTNKATNTTSCALQQISYKLVFFLTMPIQRDITTTELSFFSSLFFISLLQMQQNRASFFYWFGFKLTTEKKGILCCLFFTLIWSWTRLYTHCDWKFFFFQPPGNFAFITLRSDRRENNFGILSDETTWVGRGKGVKFFLVWPLEISTFFFGLLTQKICSLI